MALRLLRLELARDPARRAAFHRAAQRAAGLDHPAIVQVHALLEHGETDVLVMQLVAGETLAQRLRGGLAARLAPALAAEVAEALAAAHAREVTHGDLRAEKVRIGADGHARVLDFGFAVEVFGGAAASGGGEPGGPGVRADLLALGGLLRAMTGGQPPAGGLADELTAAAASLPSAAEIARRLRTTTAGRTPGGAASMPAHAVDLADPADPTDPIGLADPASPSDIGADAGRRRRHRRLPAGAAVALAAAVAAGLILHEQRQAGLAVALAPPAVVQGTGDAGVDLLAAGLREALLHTLETLDGIDVVPPEETDRVAPASPVALARWAAAGEVVTSHLSCRQGACEVSLDRVQGRDGSLLWVATLEARVAEPLALAVAVEGYAHRMYAGHRQRAGARALEVEPRDFQRYLGLRRDLAAPGAERRLDQALARVGELRATSPRFLEGALLEAELLRRPDLARCRAVLAQARALGPADPRPLAAEIDAATLAGRRAEAATALAALARLGAGEAEVAARRAAILERFGEPGEAADALRTAVRLRPSWTSLSRLARLEDRLGDTAAASTLLTEARALLPPAAAPGRRRAPPG